MDREVWRVIVHGVAELDMTEQLNTWTLRSKEVGNWARDTMKKKLNLQERMAEIIISITKMETVGWYKNVHQIYRLLHW